MRYLDEASKHLDQSIQHKTKLADIPGLVMAVAHCEKPLGATASLCV